MATQTILDSLAAGLFSPRRKSNPKTGKRIHRERPKSDWKIREAEELRIASENVWQAAQQRSAVVRNNFLSGRPKGLCGRSFSSGHLLSGLLKCGICGNVLTIVSGRGMSNWGRYGCRFMLNVVLAQMG
jgi:hypothetical protein